MADISLTTPSKTSSATATAAVETAAEAREPYWDLIELLFFAYRDFVGDPDQVLERLGFFVAGQGERVKIAVPSWRPDVQGTTVCCISSTAIPA